MHRLNWLPFIFNMLTAGSEIFHHIFPMRAWISLLQKYHMCYYEGKSTYNALKDISKVSEYKIRNARIKHEANEDKEHFVQCKTVPEEINNEIGDFKLEPCYKIFTRILADKKMKKKHNSAVHHAYLHKFLFYKFQCSKII